MELIGVKGEMKHTRVRIAERNETVLSVQHFPERLVDQAQELIQIRGDVHSVNDLKHHLPLGLRPLARGNFFDRAFIEENRAVRIAHGPRILREPDLAAVLAIDPIFKPFDDSLFLHLPLEFQPAVGVHIHLMSDVGDARHQLLWRCIAIHARQSGIDADVSPLGCRLEDALDGVFHDAAVLLLGLPQRLFGPPALSDIVVVGDNGFNARLRQEITAGPFHPPPSAIPSQQTIFGRDDAPRLAGQFGQQFSHAFAIVRMNQLKRVAAHIFFQGITQDACGRRTGVQDRSVHTEQRLHIAAILKERAKTLLA